MVQKVFSEAFTIHEVSFLSGGMDARVPAFPPHEDYTAACTFHLAQSRTLQNVTGFQCFEM